ncbi:MAG: oligosaccharide flippase family protein, partial [Candidatus Pacearchaeota archaeon]
VLTGFIISLEFNRKILNSQEIKSDFKNIRLESVPYFVSMLIVTIILSYDIILAKAFFSSEIAGRYAALSMIGKIIFFGTMAVSKTMFPLTSEKKYKKENTSNLFKKSFLAVAFLCLVAIFTYALFPNLIINLLYGEQYLELSPFLFYLGISFSLLALTNLVLVYNLSTNSIKKPFYLFILFALGVVLLFLFHSTIFEYIIAFMVSNAIMFIGTLFLLIKWRKQP